MSKRDPEDAVHDAAIDAVWRSTVLPAVSQDQTSVTVPDSDETGDPEAVSERLSDELDMEIDLNWEDAQYLSMMESELRRLDRHGLLDGIPVITDSPERFEHDLKDRASGLYNTGTGELYVAPEEVVGEEPRERQAREGYFSTDKNFGSVWHELGHHWVRQTDYGPEMGANDGENYWGEEVKQKFAVEEIKGWDWEKSDDPGSIRRAQNELDRKTEDTVSEYAIMGSMEFVAEVFAGLIAGHEYPDWVMELYERLGGYVPPEGARDPDTAYVPQVVARGMIENDIDSATIGGAIEASVTGAVAKIGSDGLEDALDDLDVVSGMNVTTFSGEGTIAYEFKILGASRPTSVIYDSDAGDVEDIVLRFPSLSDDWQRSYSRQEIVERFVGVYRSANSRHNAIHDLPDMMVAGPYGMTPHLESMNVDGPELAPFIEAMAEEYIAEFGGDIDDAGDEWLQATDPVFVDDADARQTARRIVRRTPATVTGATYNGYFSDPSITIDFKIPARNPRTEDREAVGGSSINARASNGRITESTIRFPGISPQDADEEEVEEFVEGIAPDDWRVRIQRHEPWGDDAPVMLHPHVHWSATRRDVEYGPAVKETAGDINRMVKAWYDGIGGVVGTDRAALAQETDPVPQELRDTLADWEPSFEINGTGGDRTPWHSQWDSWYEADAGVSMLYFPDQDTMLLDNRGQAHHNTQWNVAANRGYVDGVPDRVMPATMDKAHNGDWYVEMARTHGGLHQALSRADLLDDVTQLTTGSRIPPEMVWDVVYAARKAGIPPEGYMSYSFKQELESADPNFSQSYTSTLDVLYGAMAEAGKLPEPAIDREALREQQQVVAREYPDDAITFIKREGEDVAEPLRVAAVEGVFDDGNVVVDTVPVGDRGNWDEPGTPNHANPLGLGQGATVRMPVEDFKRLQEYIGIEVQAERYGEDMSPDSVEDFWLATKGEGSQQRIEEYKEILLGEREPWEYGDGLAMPYVEIGSDGSLIGSQEGRHRAIAAERAGLDTMPVRIVYNEGKEGEGLDGSNLMVSGGQGTAMQPQRAIDAAVYDAVEQPLAVPDFAQPPEAVQDHIVQYFEDHEQTYRRVWERLDQLRYQWETLTRAQKVSYLKASYIFSYFSVQTDLGLAEVAFERVMDGWGIEEALQTEIPEYEDTPGLGPSKSRHIRRTFEKRGVFENAVDLIESGNIDAAHKYMIDEVKGLSAVKAGFTLAQLGFVQKMCIDGNVARLFGAEGQPETTVVDKYEGICMDVQDMLPDRLTDRLAPYELQWLLFDWQRLYRSQGGRVTKTQDSTKPVATHDEWFDIMLGDPSQIHRTMRDLTHEMTGQGPRGVNDPGDFNQPAPENVPKQIEQSIEAAVGGKQINDREFGVIVPKYDNSGRRIKPEVLEEIAQNISERFGGVTVYPSIAGCWIPDEGPMAGELMCDENIYITTVRDSSDGVPFEEDADFLKSIGEDVAQDLGQLSVMVTEDRMEAEFIEGNYQESLDDSKVAHNVFRGLL